MPGWLVAALAGLTPEGAVFLALGLFGTSLVPFFALLDVDFARAAHTAATAARDARSRAALTTAGLLLILNLPTGDLT
ncbi:hypothetical protein ABZ650_20335 [Streptomyces griseoviridis]|uniref:hypothetical protein n=1 Tax=Streptomyces griseoviridis TaxID=45398 RepID=UPI0033C01F0F